MPRQFVLPGGGVSVAVARGRPPKTDSAMEYHDGYIMPGHSNVYFLFYGYDKMEEEEEKGGHP